MNQFPGLKLFQVWKSFWKIIIVLFQIISGQKWIGIRHTSDSSLTLIQVSTIAHKPTTSSMKYFTPASLLVRQRFHSFAWYFHPLKSTTHLIPYQPKHMLSRSFKKIPFWCSKSYKHFFKTPPHLYRIQFVASTQTDMKTLFGIRLIFYKELWWWSFNISVATWCFIYRNIARRSQESACALLESPKGSETGRYSMLVDKEQFKQIRATSK